MMVAEMAAARSDGTDRVVARVTRLAAGPQRHRRRGHRPLSPAGGGRGDADAAQLGGRAGLSGDGELAYAAHRRPASRTVVVDWVRLCPWSIPSRSTDLQRLAMVVDSANGVGAALDPDAVRVHEHRHRGAPAPGAASATISRCGPAGRSGPTAIGVTTAETLRPARIHVGTSAQTLLVQRRAVIAAALAASSTWPGRWPTFTCRCPDRG